MDRRAVGGRGVERGCLASVKVLKNSMTSSFARSNRGILVQSYAKLFWNEVPDRIIRLLLRIILSGDSVPKQLWRASYHHATVTFA